MRSDGERNPASDILTVRMNIDQRLDKLAERQEALSQSVELLLYTRREAFGKFDVLFEKHDAAFQKYDAAMAKNESLMTKNQTLMAQVVESIDSLARIAHAHERRITGLEDRRQ